jgi:phospholipid/cholesterol/gamma-HCH transport system substrate-binding protein
MTGRVARRAAVVAALAAAAVVAVVIASGGKSGYVLYAKFRQAGGLRQGFKVRVDGAPVGKIESLDLDKQDNVVAKLRIDGSAAPVGKDAHATARAADLLGEKYIDLQPGNTRDPAPSGSVIPPSRTGLAVELDDVINALDLPTRDALRVFLNEQGAAYVGRGNDLGAMLAVLPHSLDSTRALLDQFSADNRALGQLVDTSDRVVGSIAPQRVALGRLVAGTGQTLQTLGRRNRELAATVQRAPAALVAAQRALASLQGAAIPLGPAAHGLAQTAPRLTATLKQLPAFSAAARPTLATLRKVSPTLMRLGRSGTPVARRLRPLAGELDTFSRDFDPVTQTLDKGIGDVLGVLEGWARATQAHDAASHVFRFGATIGPNSFEQLAALMQTPSQPQSAHRGLPVLTPTPVPAVKLPAVHLPGLPRPNVGQVAHVLPQVLQQLPQKLGLAAPAQPRPDQNPSDAKPLLNYLLGP